ncbi:hypothetical protein [Cupriavidus sp. IK-TO18]|uniref:hypothetical protein n=1 Tax=Cupriavidus sp. IK-TO18 TaxID=2782182 RepID=UPI00189B2635|nr:hypothetical protein [Cupriavidus sp. IK-TO18]MBF6990930.1 hypothetical protein [Cupriavidus sp. IK-TO18]
MAACNSTDQVLDTEPAQTLIEKAIAALSALHWAASNARSADDFDGLAGLVGAMLPNIGADLEAAHIHLGGVPIGRFAPRAGIAA